MTKDQMLARVEEIEAMLRDSWRPNSAREALRDEWSELTEKLDEADNSGETL